MGSILNLKNKNKIIDEIKIEEKTLLIQTWFILFF